MRKDWNGWSLCFGEEDVRKIYRLTKAVDKVKAELLLTKCHGAGRVHRQGTAESSQAPMLFQNTVSYWHHRTRAGLWWPLLWLGVSLLFMSPLYHAQQVCFHTSPACTETYHTNENLWPSSPSKHQPPPASNSAVCQCPQWAGSGTSRIQAPSKHWLRYAATNCPSVMYSCSLARQDLCLNSAGLWLSKRNKEAILHSGSEHVPPLSETKCSGEKLHRDFRHSCYPSILRHLETEMGIKLQSLPVSLGRWAFGPARSSLPTGMKVFLLLVGLALSSFPHYMYLISIAQSDSCLAAHTWVRARVYREMNMRKNICNL